MKFANLYRRFIEDYFHIIASLHDLIKSDKKKEQRSQFALNNKTKRAFNALKVKFIAVSLLAHFNSDKCINIESNVFDVAVVAILSQLQKNDT